MKTALLSILSLITFFTSPGQRIHFCDATNKWSVLINWNGPMGEGGSTLYQMLYNGSVNRGTHTYQKLAPNPNATVAEIREDTIANKVYMPLTDTTELLLYDFNLRLGDTLKPVPGDTIRYIWVTALDSTQINGQWYKVWNFNGYEWSEIVVEEIGCLDGPDFPASTYRFRPNYASQLFCFENNGVTSPLSQSIPVPDIYLGNNYIFDNATSCSHIAALEVIKENNESLNVYLSPNPITTTSKISFSNNIASGTLTIFNNSGQMIAHSNFQNKQELTVGDKIPIPGIYFYRVTDDQNGNVFTGKFVY